MSKEPGESRDSAMRQSPEGERRRESAWEQARARLARLSAEQACLLNLAYTRALTPAEQEGLARFRAESKALLVEHRGRGRAA